MQDLFAPRRPTPADETDLADLLSPSHAPRTVYVTAEDGCHNCTHWHRGNATTGNCTGPGEREHWLTSYAYHCPQHVRRS